MNAHGTVHKYGDHVDTDVIIPARYLNTQSHQELAAPCCSGSICFTSAIFPPHLVLFCHIKSSAAN